MAFWVRALMLVVLVACKKDECPAVRKDVAVDLELAYEGVRLERERLKLDAEEAARVVASYPSRAEDLEGDFKHLELTMDCLVHADDCCSRVGRLSLHERVPVQRMASIIHYSNDLPEKLVKLMGPLHTLTESPAAIGVGADDRGVTTPWCTKVRAALAQFRAAEPTAWEAATDAANL